MMGRLKMLKPTITMLEPSTAKPLGRPPRIRGRRGVQRRRRWLAEHPLCEKCKAQTPQRVTLAQEADHVVPLSQGGKDDETNFSSLCVDHHREKTIEDMRGRGGLKV